MSAGTGLRVDVGGQDWMPTVACENGDGDSQSFVAGRAEVDCSVRLYRDLRQCGVRTDGTYMDLDDPTLEYLEDLKNTSDESDPGPKFRRGWRLLHRTAELVLGRLRIEPPSADPAYNIWVAQEKVKAEPELLDVFDGRRLSVSRPDLLSGLYRYAYWFNKTTLMDPPGSLPVGAPHVRLDGLMDLLYSSARQAVLACPPTLSRAPTEPYWELRPAGEYGVVDPPDDIDDARVEAVWWAAVRSGPITAWSPPTFELRRGELTDLVFSELSEVWFCSDALRTVVESQRQPQDDHIWLPVTVRTVPGDGARQYWLPHSKGDFAKDLWGLLPERLAGRTVILLGVSDDSLGFADRLRLPIEKNCPSVVFKKV